MVRERRTTRTRCGPLEGPELRCVQSVSQRALVRLLTSVSPSPGHARDRGQAVPDMSAVPSHQYKSIQTHPRCGEHWSAGLRRPPDRPAPVATELTAAGDRRGHRAHRRGGRGRRPTARTGTPLGWLHRDARLLHVVRGPQVTAGRRSRAPCVVPGRHAGGAWRGREDSGRPPVRRGGAAQLPRRVLGGAARRRSPSPSC